MTVSRLSVLWESKTYWTSSLASWCVASPSHGLSGLKGTENGCSVLTLLSSPCWVVWSSDGALQLNKLNTTFSGKNTSSILWCWPSRWPINSCLFHALSNLHSLNKTLHNWAIKMVVSCTDFSEVKVYKELNLETREFTLTSVRSSPIKCSCSCTWVILKKCNYNSDSQSESKFTTN